jgi:hypothetical protein
VNRQPPPGSRPEKYSTPASKGSSSQPLHNNRCCRSSFLMTHIPHFPASDPAQNPYWKRDVRRAYPQLSVVTQSELSTLLIQHSGPAESVLPHFASLRFPCCFTHLVHPRLSHRLAAPPDPTSAVTATPPQQLDLPEAIGAISAARKAYSTSLLPPTPPTPFKRWVPERAPDAPHDPNAYFPMILVK